MHLRKNKAFFQNLTIKYLNVHIMKGNLLQSVLWQRVNLAGLDRFHLEKGRYFAEKTLDAHENRTVRAEMLGHLFAVLEIELANESFVQIIDILAYLSLFEYHFSFGKLHGHEDALQYVQFVMRHRTVFACKLAGYITWCVYRFFHIRFP